MTEAIDLFIDGPAGKLSVRTKGLDAKAKHVVILVQGANLSGQLGYDFAFDGRQDYSFMEALVARGYGAVTFSIRGYRDSELADHPHSVKTDEAIADTAAVIDWVIAQGFARPHLLGWSWGGRIVGRYAETRSDRIGRLVLLDPAIGGGNKVPFPEKDDWWSNAAAYFRDRLELEFMEAAAHEQLAVQAERDEPRSPNGIRVENEEGSVAADAGLINAPTLMLYGVAAGMQNYMQGGSGRADFFERLGTQDKALVVVPGGGDYGHLQNARHRMWKTIADFLDG
ncbi:alpha/beta fold hydrolase [Sphingomonas sp. AR_OL41]|uniref:alpha/beta hydrolase n=1 Tax=Sphingomonas sp. AR_OL41 TaxID=3042729 RepID=UPI0024817C59|nr:alpha/beta fold hydrolase [Sphingomonas sp. AR_OL41]MDH7973268.1 alpha/beta fold hydrolase [Sphingomonas sp. AR_OL41]